MKDFKPTGYGPSNGFKFPASMGFTGSTGAYTNVQPYVRRAPRAFKDGGYVSQTVGDQGSALVRRARSYTNEDQESGGKSPLRPGFKKGGKVPGPPSMKKNPNPMKAKGAPEDAMKRSPRKMRKADGGMVGMGAFQQLSRARKRPAPKAPSASTVKEKFAADGGMVHGSNAKPLMESIADIPALAREGVDAIKRSMSSGRRAIGMRGRSVMEQADTDVTGKTTASNYKRGGKVMAARYAKGGAVSMGKVAKSAVMKHVNTPAPKGHKGLGAMCKG